MLNEVFTEAEKGLGCYSVCVCGGRKKKEKNFLFQNKTKYNKINKIKQYEI